MSEFNKSNRISILDSLRGASIIFVVVYHILYDLITVFSMRIDFFYSKTMDYIHFIFLAILIGVSGISTSFSRNIFKRGATIYLLGTLITIITSIFLPSEVIVFGILSFFGLSMLIYGVLKPILDKIPWLVQFIIWVVLYVVFYNFDETNGINLFGSQVTVPAMLTTNEYLYPIGIKTENFYSADYFSLIPWFFIFLAGTALSKPIVSHKFPNWFYKFKMPVLDFLGRNTLIIYIIHQPIIYGLLWTIYKIL